MNHPELAGFPVVIELDVAWGEMDAYAHVNNVVYFRYFESARIPYLDRIGWTRSKEETSLGPIVASIQARYRKPVAYPDHLWVGARLIDLQPDRITLEHKVVSAKWNAVATEGQVVVVSYDYRSARKAPIPDAIRAAILKLEGKSESPGTDVPGLSE
ncbi:MAG TPA: thioesterase family protein [Gemmataceae bacterium]|nr:thioesterase family protein [Gemmataceae bacterium]